MFGVMPFYQPCLFHYTPYVGGTVSSSSVEEYTIEVKVYLIWQKKVIENHDKSKITKHLILPIRFCQFQN